MKIIAFVAALGAAIPFSANAVTPSELAEAMMAAQIGSALELGLVYGVVPTQALNFTTSTDLGTGAFSYALSPDTYGGAPISLAASGQYDAAIGGYQMTGIAAALGLGPSTTAGTMSVSADGAAATVVSTVTIDGAEHVFTRYENYKFNDNGTASTFSAVYTRSSDGHETYLKGDDVYTGDGKYQETVTIGAFKFVISGLTNPGGTGTGQFSLVAVPVPEPDTYALLLAGLGLVGVLARRHALLARTGRADGMLRGA